MTQLKVKDTLTCTFCKREFHEDSAVDMRYFMTHRCTEPNDIFAAMREYEAEFYDDDMALPKTVFVMGSNGRLVSRLEDNDNSNHPSTFMMWLSHERVDS